MIVSVSATFSSPQPKRNYTQDLRDSAQMMLRPPRQQAGANKIDLSTSNPFKVDWRKVVQPSILLV
jgi:hypothetical protein